MKNDTIQSVNNALKALTKANATFTAHVNTLKDNISEEDMVEFQRISGVGAELLKNKGKFDKPEDVQEFLKKNNIY